MHTWGEKDKDGNDICDKVYDVAIFIGTELMATKPNILMQAKEKFGTVRVYCEHPRTKRDQKIYRNAYKKALKKWPELREEILCCADWPEYLKGL